jgi:hypothetical protein
VCYAIGFWQKSSDYLSLVRDREYIIVTIIMLLSHGINMYNNWRSAKMGLDGLGPGWATEQGSGCICSACVD